MCIRHWHLKKRETFLVDRRAPNLLGPRHFLDRITS
jgi:hypothetical protein